MYCIAQLQAVAACNTPAAVSAGLSTAAGGQRLAAAREQADGAELQPEEGCQPSGAHWQQSAAPSVYRPAVHLAPAGHLLHIILCNENKCIPGASMQCISMGQMHFNATIKEPNGPAWQQVHIDVVASKRRGMHECCREVTCALILRDHPRRSLCSMAIRL